jgi:ataxia telangiectasia mutated family protein
LKRYVRNNGSSLEGKVWKLVLDSLFQLANADRPIYLKATKRSAATSRMSECAKTVLFITEAAVSRVQIGTMKGLFDHIIQILPTSTGLIEPLALNYLKAMRCALEIQSHAEHLRDSWRQLLVFCVDSLDRFLEPIVDENASNSRSTVRSSHTSSVFGSIDRPSKTTLSPLETDELVACIKCLHLASNGDVHSLADKSIDSLINYLELTTSYGRAHVDALLALNLILERISRSDIELTTVTAKRLIPILTNLWSFKSSHLRDEILRFLIITRLHIVKAFETDAENEFQASVDNLISTLRDDYSQRPSRDQLHLDDLGLNLTLTHSVLHLPAAYGLNVKSANNKAESNWTGIYFLALYSMLMDQSRSIVHISERSTKSMGSKRLRLSLYIEDFMRTCSSAIPRTQICMLQILSFRVSMEALSVDKLESIVAFAIDYSSGSNHSVASWAYLLLLQ